MSTTALATIAGQANDHHEQAEAKAHQAIGHALEAGQLLVEAKAQVAHGQWANWLASNFTGSNRTAQSYMRLSNNRGAVEAKTQCSAHLSIDSALKLLAQRKQAGSPWFDTVMEHLEQARELRQRLSAESARIDALAGMVASR